jgi:hypothetical protein
MNGDILLSKASSGRISLCNVDWWGVAFPDVGSEQKNVATNHYLIGRGLTTLDRELTIHIPSYESYSSTGIIPKARFVATGDKTLLTINATGNVGIGTTNPQTKLHVEGSVFGSGLAIQCITTQYTAQTAYSSPTGLTPTQVSVLNLTITPKRATSKIVLQWMVNAEFHQDNVFLVYRDTTLIGYNTDRGNVQFSGVVSAAYDQNEDSTPSNFCINWIDTPATTSAITYSLRVRSSSAGSYTLYVNRTVAQVGNNSYEAMCSNGIAWEISA